MIDSAGWKHFTHILFQPDNIPIVIMVVFLGICLGYAVYEMRENDKLIKSGKKDQVYDRMIR